MILNVINLIFIILIFLLIYMRYYINYSDDDYQIDENIYKIFDDITKDKEYYLTENEKDLFKNTNNVSTYGYMTFEGIQKMLETLNKYNNNKNLNFIDIGSGIGRVPITLSSSNKFSNCIGLELSSTRHKVGHDLVKNNNIKNVNLINDDMFNYDKYNEVDCIYISSLCFSPNMMEKLVKIFENKLKKGCLIFTSKALPNHNFHSLKLIEKLKVKMSWTNESELHLYSKE